MTRNDNSYADMSDGERMERDWQREQQAEARYLAEIYSDGCQNCGTLTEPFFTFAGFRACQVCAEEPAVHSRGEQLNLFEETK
jgi:hypothetical protein